MLRPKNAYYYFPLPLPSSFFFLFSFCPSASFSFFPGGMRRPKYAPCFFPFFSPGRLRRPKYASVSLSLSLSLSVSVSLSLSFFLSFVPFFLPFFFFPSLGYLLYFLFARLGMACSSSASLPSRPLSSTRSRSFFALVGVVALGDPKPGFPVVLVSCLGFCPRRPNLGPFCFFWAPLLRLFSVGVFARFWGAWFFLPPKKRLLAPL